MVTQLGVWLKRTKKSPQNEVIVLRVRVWKTVIFRWLEEKRDLLEDERDEQTPETATGLEERCCPRRGREYKEGPTSNANHSIFGTGHESHAAAFLKCI